MNGRPKWMDIFETEGFPIPGDDQPGFLSKAYEFIEPALKPAQALINLSGAGMAIPAYLTAPDLYLSVLEENLKARGVEDAGYLDIARAMPGLGQMAREAYFPEQQRPLAEAALTVGELGLEVGTDPATYLTGGLAKLPKAWRAAKTGIEAGRALTKAQRLARLAEIPGRVYGSPAAAAVYGPEVARAVVGGAQQALQEGWTEAGVAGALQAGALGLLGTQMARGVAQEVRGLRGRRARAADIEKPTPIEPEVMERPVPDWVFREPTRRWLPPGERPALPAAEMGWTQVEPTRRWLPTGEPFALPEARGIQGPGIVAQRALPPAPPMLSSIDEAAMQSVARPSFEAGIEQGHREAIDDFSEMATRPEAPGFWRRFEEAQTEVPARPTPESMAARRPKAKELKTAEADDLFRSFREKETKRGREPGLREFQKTGWRWEKMGFERAPEKAPEVLGSGAYWTTVRLGHATKGRLAGKDLVARVSMDPRKGYYRGEIPPDFMQPEWQRFRTPAMHMVTVHPETKSFDDLEIAPEEHVQNMQTIQNIARKQGYKNVDLMETRIGKEGMPEQFVNINNVRYLPIAKEGKALLTEVINKDLPSYMVEGVEYKPVITDYGALQPRTSKVPSRPKAIYRKYGLETEMQPYISYRAEGEVAPKIRMEKGRPIDTRFASFKEAAESGIENIRKYDTDIPPLGFKRLYRGGTIDQPSTTGLRRDEIKQGILWFSSDSKKAAEYGKVDYLDFPYRLTDNWDQRNGIYKVPYDVVRQATGGIVEKPKARPKTAPTAPKEAVRFSAEEIQKRFGPRSRVLRNKVFDDGSWAVQLPNGKRVAVRVHEGGLDVDLSDARVQQRIRETYGPEFKAKRITGQYTPLDVGGIIDLAKDPTAPKTLNEETFHAAMDLALTENQRRAILKQFGTEEKAAHAYVDWDPKTPNTLFGKIRDFFSGLLERFRPTWEGTFKRLREGKVFEQKATPTEVRTARYAAEANPTTPERLQGETDGQYIRRAYNVADEILNDVIDTSRSESAASAFVEGTPQEKRFRSYEEYDKLNTNTWPITEEERAVLEYYEENAPSMPQSIRDAVKPLMKDIGGKKKAFEKEIKASEPEAKRIIAEAEKVEADIAKFFEKVDEFEDLESSAAKELVPEARRILTEYEQRKTRGIRYAVEEAPEPFVVYGKRSPEVAATGLREVYFHAEGIPVATPEARRFVRPEETQVDAFRRAIQDRMLRVKKIQEQVVKGGGKVEDASDVYRHAEVYSGRAFQRLLDFEDAYTKPILQEMHSSKISPDQIADFLEAKHAPDRNARIAQINPDFKGPGSGLTNEEAAKILSDFDRKGLTRQLESIANKVYEFQDNRLEGMIADGILSREEADAWRKAFGKYYIPLKSEEADDFGFGYRLGTGKGFTVRGREAKAALGRRTRPFNPLAAALAQTQASVVRGEKNRVVNSLRQLVLDNPDDSLWRIREKLPTREALVNGEAKSIPDFKYPDENYVIPGKINGKQYYIEVDDPLFARAVKNLGSDSTGKVIRWVGQVTRFYKNLVTSWYPEFLLTNPIRDIQTAAFNLGAESKAKIVRRMIAGVPGALRGAYAALRNPNAKGEWVDLYRDAAKKGGLVSWLGSEIKSPKENLDKIYRDLERQGPGTLRAMRKATRGAFKWLEDANKAMETAARLSAYRALKEAGVSELKRLSAMKNLTVNFDKRGELSPTLNAAYAFFNASVQGGVRMLQALNTKRGRRMAIGVVFGGVVADQWNRANAGDANNDGVNDYDAIPGFVKERNLILMRGPGKKPVMIPLPYGYNVLHALGVHASSASAGAVKPGKAAVEVANAAMGAFNPLGESDIVQQMAPTIADPIVQHVMNRNWTGRLIRPEPLPFEPKKPDSEMFFRTVNPISRMATKILGKVTGGDEVTPGVVDISPESIDHLVGFTGIIGKMYAGAGEAIKGKEITVRQVPMVRRFVYEPHPAETSLRYRDVRSEIETLEKRAKYYREKRDVKSYAALPKHLLRVIKPLRAIENQIQSIKRGHYRDAEERIRELQRRAIKIVEQARRKS